jgi:hypothetical protein
MGSLYTLLTLGASGVSSAGVGVSTFVSTTAPSGSVAIDIRSPNSGSIDETSPQEQKRSLLSGTVASDKAQVGLGLGEEKKAPVAETSGKAGNLL